jgi:NadR type nicotinamide-nucleotide adenylyltransferase
MLLGKFMPPHLGHRYLVDFARHRCDRLTVLVCSNPREPIAGELRHDWMQRMFPDCEVLHITDPLPLEPSEAEDFWDQWRAMIRRHLPEGPDFVFASEDYGHRLAAELGSEFVPVDLGRELVPVSGSAIRGDPMTHWAYLPVEVRPHYLKRVCVFGPESTGKTTLARDLAAHFDTVWAHEYARPLLDRKGGVCDYEDLERIALGQAAAEAALAYQANRVLFTDTDPLTTRIWSEVLFEKVPPVVETLATRHTYDLTLLCDVDVPWVDDDQRFLGGPAERQAFFSRCQEALEARQRPFVRISGDWRSRLAAAVAAVEALLSSRSTASVP